MVSHGKLLLGSVESYQSNMVPQLGITIQQYSSIDESSCFHHLLLKETYGQLHDAFAWGQAKFRGGSNVTPRMESKESSALIDKWAHQPWDPGRREDSSIYCPAKGKGKNRKYLTNRNRGQEGDLPPGYRDHLLGFPPVIAHVTGLISPAATGCDSGIRDGFRRLVGVGGGQHLLLLRR